MRRAPSTVETPEPHRHQASELTLSSPLSPSISSTRLAAVCAAIEPWVVAGGRPHRARFRSDSDAVVAVLMGLTDRPSARSPELMRDYFRIGKCRSARSLNQKPASAATPVEDFVFMQSA
jgi:hypothetical protein